MSETMIWSKVFYFGMISSCSLFVKCFNIDIKNHVKFSGDAESYFGYSLVMADNKWIIAGAPRANCSYLPSVDSPGTIYRCNVSDGKPLCEEIHIDGKLEDDSASFDDKLLFFRHGKNGQWLGGAVDLISTASGWEIVVCAPRWYNRKFEAEREFDMNGICYLIPSDLQEENILKLPAMIGASKRTAKTSWGQEIYNYAMAGMGISLHVTKENQNVLIGAPGLKYWTGGFVEMEGKSVKYMESDLDRVNDTHDSYVGYTLTSGRYFQDRQVYYAVGAPRYDLTGRVFFFRSDSDSFVLEQADSDLIPTLKTEENNIPMNSYFGSVLCSVDVNADGYDDLLVGAPLFANQPPEYDTGATFLYLGASIRGQRFYVPNFILWGSNVTGARFGSAIASLGDLNDDGFNDIIIGAPYEDDGRGSVYIYNGYYQGLWLKHSLKILGRSVDKDTFGFGASLCNAMDINRDNINGNTMNTNYVFDKITAMRLLKTVKSKLSLLNTEVWKESFNRWRQKRSTLPEQRSTPIITPPVSSLLGNCLVVDDIAVGAYASSNVVLLFGQPVIRMTTWIEIAVAGDTNGNQDKVMIKRDSHTIAINTCFRFTDNIDTHSIILNVTLTLDSGFESKPRLLFKSSNTEKRQLQVRVWRGDSICTVPLENDFAYVQPTNNLVSPVIVLAKYEVEHAEYHGAGVEPTLNKFNGKSPKDPILEVSRELHFLKDCDNNVCKTDLHLRAEATFESINEHFIIGSQFITLQINVTKDGDPAYGSIFNFTFPSFLRFRKSEDLSDNIDFSCFMDNLDQITKPQTVLKLELRTLICNLGNPIYNDSGIQFLVVLQVPLELPESSFVLRSSVKTLSNENNLADNDRVFIIKTISYVKPSLSGLSDPKTTFINKHREIVISQHIYEFANAGPSPLPEASVRYLIPEAKPGKGTRLALYLNETKFEYPRTSEMSCKSHQNPLSPLPYFRTNGKLKGYMSHHNTSNHPRPVIEECAAKTCSYIECRMGKIPAKTTILTTLIFVITNEILEEKAMILITRAAVHLNVTNLFSSELRLDKTLSTELLPQTPPTKEVDIWVIIVSAVVGVLLLFILIMLLFKVGFFKRKLRDELVRQKSIKSTKRNDREHTEDNLDQQDNYKDSSKMNLTDDMN